MIDIILLILIIIIINLIVKLIKYVWSPSLKEKWINVINGRYH